MFRWILQSVLASLARKRNGTLTFGRSQRDSAPDAAKNATACVCLCARQDFRNTTKHLTRQGPDPPLPGSPTTPKRQRTSQTKIYVEICPLHVLDSFSSYPAPCLRGPRLRLVFLWIEWLLHHERTTPHKCFTFSQTLRIICHVFSHISTLTQLPGTNMVQTFQ